MEVVRSRRPDQYDRADEVATPWSQREMILCTGVGRMLSAFRMGTEV
jgi:hypothetical protein